MLLDRRKATDLPIAGERLVVGGDEAFHLLHAVIFQGLDPQMPVEQLQGDGFVGVRDDDWRFDDPVFGQIEADGQRERNHLDGPDGDAVNAIPCAIVQNCRLLLALFLRLLARLLLSAPRPATTILRAAAAAPPARAIYVSGL